MADIYITLCGDERGNVYPPERQLQIDETQSEKLKKQRIAAWQALSEGIEHSFSQKVEDLHFSQLDSGAWRCDDEDKSIFFSLSHSGSFAAAAVAPSPVGLDIEIEAAINSRSPENINALFLRSCTQKEQSMYSPAAFASLWTKKESIFKYSGEKSFSPSKIETSDYPVKSYRCGELVVSVCSRDKENRFFSLSGEEILPLEAEET